MEEKETKDKLLMMNDYYDDIKRELIKNNVTKAVKQYSINRSDLNTYYEVGRLLSEAGKHYGDNIIKKYAEMLSLDLESKYESSYLYKMKRFYLLIEKVATLSPKLTYGHYVELLPYEDVNKVKYYIKLVEDNNLTIRELRAHIKSNEYERLPETAKNKLIKENETSVIDFVKNPIVIKTNDNEEHINEKKLQSLIMEYLSSFLDELGDGFLFKKNEYKINLGDRYNYIDMLLYNIKYRCYVVVELKVTELKKEHIGQIQVYMNYIDKNVKSINDNKTVGIIICKRNNRYVIDYCSDPMITTREYILLKM